jgi:hypothetical protein
VVDDKGRTAGSRQAERLSAGLGSADIAKRVHQETDSTSRVYVFEWMHDSRHRTAEQAAERVQTRYQGRLREGDWDILMDNEGGVVTHVVRIKHWNVAAEFKHAWQAEQWAEILPEERQVDPVNVKVVPRNSRTEHQLRSYGQLKLLAPQGS